MGKKSEELEKLKREDPKENNWEIEEPETVNMPETVNTPEPPAEPKEKITGTPLTLDSSIRDGLKAAFAFVPDEMKNLEVAAWSLRNDGATFVFKDGRKYRVDYK